MPSLELPQNEWIVLALLAEQPNHGFAIARVLEKGTDIGRLVTVHRPLVYRALDRLVLAGLAKASQPEPGARGPQRRQHVITTLGRSHLREWLQRPVDHVRDLRIVFLVKLRLIERSGGDARPLVVAQQAALAETLSELLKPDAGSDVVGTWRRHNAAAVACFLKELSD